ncbi:ABC transporter substrate-binding protein [Actinomadura vinacea]|uniref:ABC transporter substrate-binding protein n=1 Tax=Actinomadura vinacea TaxID=115336 RepID=A0ABN3IHR9_9ACTN
MLAVGAAVAVSIALAGCSGDRRTAGGAAAGPPQRGGKLVIAEETQPLSGLDPVLAQAGDAKRMASQFYEGLLELAPDGITLKPALATSWKRTSPTSYEFTLREGTRFHDGRPVKASDVVFSLKRYVDPATKSPYRALFKIKDVTASGDDKVVVTLQEPQSSLLNLLAQPWSGGIVSEQWVKSRTPNQRKIQENGTGPFRLAEFREGAFMKTVRFDGYWDQPKPYIDEVRYQVIPEEVTRVRALQSTTVDATQINIPKVTETLEKGGFEVGEPFKTGVYWLGLNTLQGPLANEKVRQAISLGIDRKQLISVGAQGSGVPSGIIPPGDPVLGGASGALPFGEYDPGRAKRLLAESGAGPVKLKMVVRSNRPDKLATAQLITEQLSRIGVRVQITQLPFEQLVSNLLSGNWNADMVQMTSVLNADVSQYLSLWFEKTGKTTKVNDPELWRRMDDAVRNAETVEDRRRAYGDINRYVAERVYMLVPYASPVNYDAWSTRLAGFKSDATGTRRFLKDAWIAE